MSKYAKAVRAIVLVLVCVIPASAQAAGNRPDCKVSVRLDNILYLGEHVGKGWSFNSRAVVNGTARVTRIPARGIVAIRSGQQIPADQFAPRTIVGPVVVGKKGDTLDLSLQTRSIAAEDDTNSSGLPAQPLLGDDTGRTSSSAVFTIKECGVADPLEIPWVDSVNVIEDAATGQNDDTLPPAATGAVARMVFLYTVIIDP